MYSTHTYVSTKPPDLLFQEMNVRGTLLNMWLYLTLALLVGSHAKGDACTKEDKQCQPEQIHISYSDKPTQMVVTWSTIKDTSHSVAQIQQSDSSSSKQQVEGTRTLFTDGGSQKLNQTIHRVFLYLKPNITYQYSVGSKYGMSKFFNVTTVPEGEDWEVRALIFGDLGLENGKSTPFLIKEASQNHYDMAFHVGDLAYDMYEDNGKRGNDFMNAIQPLAANVPYMVCPGNHEAAYNFTHFRKRFTMPLWERFESYFYSFNLGPVHFVSINTEAYFNDDSTIDPAPMLDKPTPTIMTQYEWLDKDLKEANKPENRQKRPWIVILGHRPMYCSTHNDNCREGPPFIQRVGFPDNGGYGLEVLLMNYRVDLAIWAHEHSYERLWPIYHNAVYNGTTEHTYTNPGAPVHITTGSAGCREGESNFYTDPYEWSAFRIRDYGYTRLHAYNKTHLQIEQMSTEAVSARLTSQDLEAKVIDEFWLIKDSVSGNSEF